MEIFVNGEAVNVPDACTLTDLVRQLSLLDARIAVEINREIIPRSLHHSTSLSSGDRVEIVQAIGGG